jgi:hypothetical protein
MDELHDRIADFLRGQRHRAAVEAAREARILAIWRARGPLPRCRVCGRAF